MISEPGTRSAIEFQGAIGRERRGPMVINELDRRNSARPCPRGRQRLGRAATSREGEAPAEPRAGVRATFNDTTISEIEESISRAVVSRR